MLIKNPMRHINSAHGASFANRYLQSGKGWCSWKVFKYQNLKIIKHFFPKHSQIYQFNEITMNRKDISLNIEAIQLNSVSVIEWFDYNLWKVSIQPIKSTSVIGYYLKITDINWLSWLEVTKLTLKFVAFHNEMSTLHN